MMKPGMKKLASFSLLATALACGAAILPEGNAPPPAPGGAATTLQPTGAPQDPQRPQDPDKAQPTGRLQERAQGELQAPELDDTLAGDLVKRTTPTVEAVRAAAESVVSIYILHPVRMSNSAELSGQGSGVVLDSSGLVITNWHVVAGVLLNPDALRVQVRMKNGKAYLAQVLSSSPEYDLALLQLELEPGETIKPVAWGDSESLMIGEDLIAIGNPQGHTNTVTRGVLSAKDRRITVQAPDGRLREYKDLLQTDAAINQGNSGGALLDITGKLMGINNAMAVGAENIGFAIPVNVVKRVFDELLLSSEDLAEVWLGMRVRTTGDRSLVYDVHPLGPAARAGVKEGDQIVTVQQQQVHKAVDYARALLKAQRGEPLDVEVLRGGRRVVAKPVPMDAVEADLLRLAGIAGEEVTWHRNRSLLTTASYAAGLRRPLQAAVRVTQVFPDSPAAELGLQRGDLLLYFTLPSRVYSRYVFFGSARDMAEKMRALAGQGVEVTVLRGDDALEGTLHLRSR